MKRRTLDVLFSVGGLVIAVLLVLAGIVLTSNANFANDYVTDQLTAQKIMFKPADQLTEEEAAQPCLVEFAGQQLTTGKQAECYANNFIGLHVQSVADGKTYAELGAPQAALREQVATAEENNDPALPQLQAQLDEINGQRDTLFKGETLRGLLLTSFGFSQFGEKASQAATVAYIAAFVMFVLALAGFSHAAKTPETAVFAPVEKPEPDTTKV
jgi:hypothetical protein